MSQPERTSQPLPVGSAVAVSGGPWSGAFGRIDRLTDTVGGQDVLVVRADEALAGAQWMPRTLLLVVRREHAREVDAAALRRLARSARTARQATKTARPATTTAQATKPAAKPAAQ